MAEFELCVCRTEISQDEIVFLCLKTRDQLDVNGFCACRLEISQD